ncbi:MAG TPA: hypothetical protein PL137_24090, partial [Nocardioides sp.]|nr:hypothetical protein [Nocardioides sp.]
MSEEVGQLSTEVEHEFEHELEQGPGLAVVPGRAAHASTAVLQAKLRPGANPGHVVPRPRLHARLEESVDVPLTLVVAPAGSGKTSLLRCWAAETEVPVAWLTLDEEDRDPVRLWRGVFAALDALAPGAAAVAADLVDGPGGVPEAVGALLDELENRDREPAVLVIDDAHVVDDAWGSSLAGFVQHLPFWLHLIVAGRRTPELRVDRLRARGVLAEVQFPELRFTVDEATEMLARLVPDLDPETATRVIERAGGWAASIQLAALAARSAETQGRGYLPDHDDLARMEDYVWREVLAEERDDVVDVLVAITVVDDVETELATVLSGRADAAARLALAEQRGLFVARSETSGFVLHPLMRDVLRSGLGRTDPERVVRLHALAAGWFEVHGRTEQALDHWIAAERPRDALRLLAAQAFPLYDAGHEDTIVRIVGELPESVVPGDLDAMIEYAWAHLLVDRARFLDLVESLSRTTRDDLDVDPVRGARVQVLESIAATLRGHWADGGSLARSALQELGEAWWLDPIGRCAWNMVARDLALSERWDDAGHARRGIVRALGAVPDRRIALEGTRALAEALAGHPVDALRLATGARHATEASSASITRAPVRPSWRTASR